MIFAHHFNFTFPRYVVLDTDGGLVSIFVDQDAAADCPPLPSHSHTKTPKPNTKTSIKTLSRGHFSPFCKFMFHKNVSRCQVLQIHTLLYKAPILHPAQIRPQNVN